MGYVFFCLLSYNWTLVPLSLHSWSNYIYFPGVDTTGGLGAVVTIPGTFGVQTTRVDADAQVTAGGPPTAPDTISARPIP